MPPSPRAPTLDRVSEEVRELSEDQTGADAGSQDAVLLFVGGPLAGRVEIREARHGEPLPTITHVHLHGGPAPVRQYLPKLIDLVFNGTINPGKVFDLVLPLAQVAEGYRAMDERRAIKTLLQP